MNPIKKLTLLHSNDLHGDFLSEQIGDKYVGGVSRLSGYINQVREEQPNTIYCVAGDMFRGSVIDSEFQGVSTIEIMNMLAPDVVTVGNHETDYGIAHLLFLEKCAKFPIINANLHITTNDARLFKPFHIVEIDGMKIMFIGILTEEVIAQTKNDGVIGSFVNIHEAIKEVGRICNAYRTVDIDLTVLLTHIGYEEDKKLAAALDPAWGIDIIIGGHTHTFIQEPEVVNNILVAQAGTGTDQIGRFDLELDTVHNCLHSYTWKTIAIDDSHCPKDAAMDGVIAYYKDQTDRKYNRVVTRFKRQLTHPTRYRETELGGLLADIMMKSLHLDIMLLASGSIRNPELGPIVLYSDLVEGFPYDDPLYMLRVRGDQLKKMIHFMLRDEALVGGHTEFYQFSEGLEVVYHRESHSFKKFNYFDEPVDDERIYTVGMQHFHYMSVGKFLSVSAEEINENGKTRMISTSCRDILEEYFSVHQNLDHTVCGRLIIE